MMRIREIEI